MPPDAGNLIHNIMKILTAILILTASLCCAQTTILVQPFDSLGNAISNFDDPILQAKLDDAISLLIPLINSNEFEKSFCKIRCLRKHGKTNCQIVDMIRNGNECSDLSCGIIRLNVAFDLMPGKKTSRVDKNKVIHVSSRYVYNNGVEVLSAELLKEYCKVLGFKNSPLQARLRVYTVPYRVEKIVIMQLHKQQADKIATATIVNE